MLIIDADSHIAPTGGEFALEKHIKRIERAGIDKALTWLKPDYTGTEIELHNRYVFEAVQEYPDKILGYGWADPTVSVEHAIKVVKVCTEEYGFYGIKLNGAQNDYRIDNRELVMPVIDAIAKTGKTLAFHIGPDAYENTHPLRAEKIAKLYPELPILMVHMGMTDQDMTDVVIEVAKNCPNMFLIGSATNDKFVLKAIHALGADRVCFGSDAPFQDPYVIRAMYEAAMEGQLSNVEQAMVMGGNIARILGLSVS
jgi:predicted TIM-barrel fold metal-dependent hydrolase